MDGKDIKKIFGLSLKEIRISKGYTQEKLSELLNIQANSIQRIENGINFIKCDTLANLCNTFKVPPAVFWNTRSDFLLKENIDYIENINKLLLTFSSNKLKEAYRILSVLNE